MAQRFSRGAESDMRIQGLADIATQFGGMLIDQFGVLHDGRKLFPGTLEVMAQLKAAGIPVAIMTNSGKRAAPNVARITSMGVSRDMFVDCVSSGEVAYQSITGGPAYIIGKQGEDYGFDTVKSVASPADAEVILIAGSDAPRTSLDDYRRLLSGVSVPAICCNPDKWMLTPTGLQPAPGTIAALYEEMGGRVTWIGKPHPGIYRWAAGLIGNPSKILCIGDSAEHDVAGGRAAGFSTLLVMTGVSEGKAIAEIEPKPDYWMSDFTW
jgi:HAD superfamily hydrolase (TIGR01459 family)